MSGKKRLYKQSKHITVMLVPDSSAKVRSLKAPRWFFNAATVILLCVVVFAVVLQIRFSLLQRRVQMPAPQPGPALQVGADAAGGEGTPGAMGAVMSGGPDAQMEALRAAFEDERARLLGDFSEQLLEKEEFVSQLAELEESFSGLQNKSRIIEDYKLEILNILDYLDEEDLHYAYYQSLFNIEMLPIGGPGIPEEYTISDLLLDYDASLMEIINELRILKITVESLLPIVDTMPSGWPVESREVLSSFGRRANPFSGYGYEMHYGVDIEAPLGTPVLATADGVVEFSGFSDGGHGNLVVITHEYGYSTLYAHNSELLVGEGDMVSRGDVIALSGNSGRATGAHCHYEVKLNGVNLDPMSFLVEAYG